jgi:hypothetical protein
MANAIEILERLIAFPSVSSRSNLDLIQWIRDELARHGVKCDLVPAARRPAQGQPVGQHRPRRARRPRPLRPH